MINNIIIISILVISYYQLNKKDQIITKYRHRLNQKECELSRVQKVLTDEQKTLINCNN